MAEDRDHTLSLAFMRRHPVQAARVLEGLPADAAAALFAQTPARLGATVLSAMLPPWAARCLASLDDQRALELLAPMTTQHTVAVLRHVPDERRQRLIADLPTAAALASTLLLGYTEDTLGAWADPDVVTLPSDTQAGAALDRQRLTSAEHALILVTDGAQRLSGVVSLTALLQAPASATLATLMQRPVAILAAHAPLVGTPAHPGWQQSSVLPVVDPGQRVVGVMTRDGLARALRRASPPGATAANAETTLPALFARSYWLTLSILLESGLALLPRVPAALESSDEH